MVRASLNAAGAAGKWDGAAYGADAEYIPDGERVIRLYNFADLLARSWSASSAALGQACCLA